MMRAKRIAKGEYMYKGYKIRFFGYYEPEHRVVWEAIDESTSEGVAHGFTKKECMREIDYFTDR